jgi:rubrerythrin
MAELTEKIKDYMSSTTVKHDRLMARLSEFLAVEQGGKKIYQRALQMARDPEVQKKFQIFYEQTIKHEEILSRIIRELGGDPTWMSPTAQLAEAKAAGLLRTLDQTEGLTPKQVELNAMENVVLAEAKDHADWELLGKIARQTTDSTLSKILKPAVDEVEPEEDQHLNWTKTQMAQLSMDALSE